ncbi:hypothetical protein Misp06_02964 [Microbulbifer sp. NBRC 101763]|uniref:SMI1/KNR4 family protein n=1 Tax=Microbulbifer sp. NBRC 101763 TaxID=1113820 RepID=UPI0030988031
MSILSIDEMLDEWSKWSRGEEKFIDNWDVNSISVPQGYIKEVIFNRKWFPFSMDYGGNNFTLDMDPGPKGKPGQVIVFGRDYDTKYVLADSLSEFFNYYIDCLKCGNYTVENDEYIDIDMPKLSVMESDQNSKNQNIFKNWESQLSSE